MRAIHFFLAASIAAHAITLGTYLLARQDRQQRVAPELTASLGLDAAQSAELVTMRRALRADLRAFQPRFTDATREFNRALREHEAGAPAVTAATQRLSAVKAEQVAIVLRHELGFRARLTPAQRERFNAHLGEGRFLYALAGLE